MVADSERILDPTFVEGLSASGKKIYVHTLNAYEDFAVYFAMGAQGIYTDLLTPSDYAI